MPPTDETSQARAGEIYVRTNKSANAERGDIDTVQSPCRDWVRLEGRYNDRWRTPMAGAEFRLWVNGAVVIPNGKLKDYEEVGLRPGQPPGNEYEAALLHEVGTFLYSNSDIGSARAEILHDPGIDDEIKDLADELRSHLDGPYRELLEQMKPFQDEWDKYGYRSLQMAQDQGFIDAAKEFGAGIAEMATAKYWEELGTSIANRFQNAVDTAHATLEQARGVINEAYDKKYLLLDESWWIARADDVAKEAKHVAAKAEEIAESAGKAIGETIEAAKAIYEHRDLIVALPEHVVAGEVDKIEEFIDTVVAKIDREAAAKLRYDKTWQAAVELLHDGEAASIFVVYLHLFLGAVPPNFWAYHTGKAGFYIILEIVMTVIGLLFGGVGAAARIASISARLIKAGGALAKVGRLVERGMEAVQAVIRMLKAFEEAVDKIFRKLKALLLKARRRLLKRGRTRSTLKHLREIEKRSGHCRRCGSNHRTPLPVRGGQLDYV